ncbi:MAG: thioredoxin [Firmicutes bacterium]|nr:thioredoxin [Bacillota bacterium]
MSKARWAWIILFALGILMCCFGAWRGEAFTVLIKGSNICMECIGLG